MIGFFDFDMTTAITQGKETPSLSQFKDIGYATQDILNAKPTKIVRRMKDYHQVYILTARSSGNGKMRDSIKRYFKKNGVYIPTRNIIMVGDYMQDKKTAEKKAIVLNRFASQIKQTIHFWDDDSNNVEYAKYVNRVKAFQV
jgi:5S rRNA maturation endonuclease (ribonuclease M5)